MRNPSLRALVEDAKRKAYREGAPRAAYVLHDLWLRARSDAWLKKMLYVNLGTATAQDAAVLGTYSNKTRFMLQRLGKRSVSTAVKELTLDYSPAAKVFDIPELAELIFLQLNMEDILLAESVCSAWELFVMTSTKLQQKLFRIDEEPAHSWIVDETRKTITKSKATALVPLDELIDALSRENSAPSIRCPMIVNPLLLYECKETKALNRQASCEPDAFHAIFFRRCPLDDDPESTASCLEMFITQPPCKYVIIMWTFTTMHPDGTRWTRQDYTHVEVGREITWRDIAVEAHDYIDQMKARYHGEDGVFEAVKWVDDDKDVWDATTYLVVPEGIFATKKELAKMKKDGNLKF